VSGLPKGITDVNVTLRSFDHPVQDDVDVVLEGPGGDLVVLMSDVGGQNPAEALNLVFDDEADMEPDNLGELFSGTYRPNNINQGDALPLPFPGAIFDTSVADDVLSAFDETDPNGVWSLYVVDDTAAGDQAAGDFSGGWSLQIETVDMPEAPTVDQPETSPSTDNDGDVILAGSGEDDTTVDVYEGEDVVGSNLVVDGEWAVALLGVEDGKHTYTAVATDEFENVSPASDPVSVRVDTVQPTVNRVRPSKGADGVGRGKDITARFDESMRDGTMIQANVMLERVGSSQPVPARVSYDPSTRTVRIDPSRKLAADTGYRAIISTRVRDLAGNRLDEKQVWRFTTR
jgi:hypothetical protein